MEYYEGVSGSRMHAAYFRPAESTRTCRPACSIRWCLDQAVLSVPQEHREAADGPHLPHAHRRHRHVSAEDAIAWGFSGPMIRASGLRGICASRSPTTYYELMDFDIPVGKKLATAFARYLVRIEEMYQSVRIMEQCVKALRTVAARCGSTTARSSPPRRGEMKDSMEALIHHFKLYNEGYKVPAARPYYRRRSAEGRVRRLLVSDGTNKPYRCQDPRTGFPAICRRST